MYSISDWRQKINELSEIYQAESEVEARHLSKHWHFIATGNDKTPFVCIHAVYLGLRGEEMRGRDGKTQNIRDLAASIARHGYRRIERSSPDFEKVWPGYLLECKHAGRDPSGGKKLQPMDRSFFVRGDILLQTKPPIAQDEELKELDHFQSSIEEALRDPAHKRHARLREASTTAKAVTREVTEYLRNRDIIAERLSIAKGNCEDCNNPAPFNRASDGSPFLEVHHVLPLADGGADTVENTLALCPNCHRKAHFG